MPNVCEVGAGKGCYWGRGRRCGRGERIVDASDDCERQQEPISMAYCPATDPSRPDPIFLFVSFRFVSCRSPTAPPSDLIAKRRRAHAQLAARTVATSAAATSAAARADAPTYIRRHTRTLAYMQHQGLRCRIWHAVRVKHTVQLSCAPSFPMKQACNRYIFLISAIDDGI